MNRLLLALLCCLPASRLGADESATEREFSSQITPLLAKYCGRCHNATKAEGMVNITRFTSAAMIIRDRSTWVTVLEKLKDEEMPPEEPFPNPAERTLLIRWVDNQVNNVDWDRHRNAGHVTSARLTRDEYDNTMRDLLGVDLRSGQRLGADAEGTSGFTNDRDGLFIAPALLEKYIQAAESSIDQLIALRGPPFKLHLESEKMFMTEQNAAPEELGYVLNRGQMTLYDSVEFPVDGLYRFTVRAWSTAGPTGARLRINDEVMGDIRVPETQPAVYELFARVEKGTHQLAWNIQQSNFIEGLAVPPNKNTGQAAIAAITHRYSDEPVPPKNQWGVLVTKRAMADHLKLQPIDGESPQVRKLREQLNNSAYSLQRPIEWLRLHGPGGDRSELIRFKGYIAERSVTMRKIKALLAGALDIAVDELDKMIAAQNQLVSKDNKIILDSVAAVRGADKPTPEKPGNVGIDWIDIEGPRAPAGMSAQPLVFLAAPGNGRSSKQAAQLVLETFARRAFRRPVARDELRRYVDLFQQQEQSGAGFHSALRLPLTAILVSPNFLFKIEQNGKSEGEFQLTDYQLASRLSYFFWTSMPDDELLALAASKRLSRTAVLNTQVARMLADPKADAFYHSFISQWLGTGAIGTTIGPDATRFPQFAGLQAAALQEPELYFGHLLRNNQSLLRLLDSGETFLNADLAGLYGIEGVEGSQMRLVELGSAERGGLLGMSSVLTATSLPLRTSPVIRGKWVLETLLGEKQPPPPPDAGDLPDNAADIAGKTLRQQYEIHRTAPQCAACHLKMDPIGFGLENFDAIGRFRKEQGGVPIDNRGDLPDGRQFNGAVELKTILLAEQHKFARNLSERMLSFALGRQLQYFDEPVLHKLTTTLLENDCRPLPWLREVVLSYPFQYQNNELPEP
jgi:hypothetical protein